jgi:hypothetical protein
MLTVTSYETDRRGQVISTTAINHKLLSDAIARKQKDSTGIMVFINADAAAKADVQAFVEAKGLSLYDTKKAETYVLGLSRKPKVACEIA